MKTAVLAALIVLSPTAALSAQTTAQSTTQTTTQPTAPASAAGKFGGLGGLLGGGIPNVGSAGVGNAAGLLGYCVKNNLLSGANAASVLGNLSNKAGVAASPGYSAGQQGTLQTGKSQLSLDGLRGQVKTQVCNLVLKRAKAFL